MSIIASILEPVMLFLGQTLPKFSYVSSCVKKGRRRRKNVALCLFTGSRPVDGVKLQPVLMDLLAQVINLSPTLVSL